jgi:hypothetical protein
MNEKSAPAAKKLNPEFLYLARTYFIINDGKTKEDAETYIESILNVKKKGKTWIVKRKNGNLDVWDTHGPCTRSLADILA